MGRSQLPNIFCIGLNYKQHAAESRMAEPANPVIFMKPTSSLCDPTDEILVDPSCQTANDGKGEVDYEVEMVIVIGKECKNVSQKNAMEYVLGYTIANDVSARQWQLDPTLAGYANLCVNIFVFLQFFFCLYVLFLQSTFVFFSSP